MPRMRPEPEKDVALQLSLVSRPPGRLRCSTKAPDLTSQKVVSVAYCFRDEVVTVFPGE
jgi:hypothetical protein